jgi:predicted AAA+ superfamily ATPase
MERRATHHLATWADTPRRRPIIVRGARQVGKTWLVRDLAARRFAGHLHSIDLERRHDLHPIFAGDLDPVRILSALEAILGKRIVPGRDLLFLDEIQACPRAIVALRYFYEELPELHVIAAGSLLEFALGGISVPVGRVDYLWLRPVTFSEYLAGIGNEVAAELVEEGPHRVAGTTHQLLLEHLRDYLFVGGMPAAVQAYAESGRLLDAFDVHESIIATYRDDFLKYQPRTGIDCLDDVLTSVAQSVGQQLKYARLSTLATPPTVKRAFALLERAQLVRRIRGIKHVGLPLGADASRGFKALVVDVGLMQRLAGLPSTVELAKTDLLGMHNGAVAEQYVGQELAAVPQRYEDLFYWARAAKSSTAEVDYVVRIGTSARPVEVKSGPAGRLRSMHILLVQQPELAPGIVLSEAPYAELLDQNLLFVPLYFAGSLERLGDDIVPRPASPARTSIR